MGVCATASAAITVWEWWGANATAVRSSHNRNAVTGRHLAASVISKSAKHATFVARSEPPTAGLDGNHISAGVTRQAAQTRIGAVATEFATGIAKSKDAPSHDRPGRTGAAM